MIEFEKLRVNSSKDDYDPTSEQELSLNSDVVWKDFSCSSGCEVVLGTAHGQKFVHKICSVFDEYTNLQN